MSQHTLIEPFTVSIGDEAIADLRSRLAGARLPEQLPGGEWQRGVPVDYLRRVADYWGTTFDWKAQEKRINIYPHFTTEIDGQRIHFLHLESKIAGAMPLLLLHGWPGSFVEFLGVVDSLVDPVAHGGTEADAFHVVVPSLPGFGFSGPLSGEGWGSKRMATALAELMARLGYERYGAQGGDFGAFVAPDLGRVDPGHVIGVHVNAATMGFIPFGELPEEEQASLTEVERARLARMRNFLSEGNGYFAISSTRPQTLSYGLNDSPIGQLAWIIEKFKEWTNSDHALPEDAIALDEILTDVSIYWFTQTAGSSANLYYESVHGSDWPTPSQVPTGVAVFAEDISIRRYAEQGNNIIHWSDFEAGGHFAALEVPDLLVADLRTFFRSLSASNEPSQSR
jgi:pimeloyl-ACP methyl ester carboxylesterase